MATFKQEQIYNEIIKYYDYADKLVDIIEASRENASQNQLDFLEQAIENIEDCADNLTIQFVELIKGGNSQKIAKNILETINDFLGKIQKYKNQVYSLYNISL